MALPSGSRNRVDGRTCGGCQTPIELGVRLRYTRGGAKVPAFYHDWCLDPKGPPNGTVPGDPGYNGSMARGVSDGEDNAKLVTTLVEVLQERLGNRGSSVDEETVRAIVADEIRSADLAVMIREQVEAYCLPTIKVEVDGGPTVVIPNAHPNMDKLTRYTVKGRHSYLHGPPGSGKSTAGLLLADALGREYGYISLTPQSMESRLVGYMDANGRYVPTMFRKLFEHGGIFVIDEMDNASGWLLTALNSALANHKGAFPDAVVDRHPDFVVIATGNTAGRGGKIGHGERRPFDEATRDRFRFLHWPIDTKLERRLALAESDKAGAWVQWVVQVRAWAATNAPTLVVTPRASIYGAQDLRDGHTVADTAEAVVFRGLDDETRTKALAACPLPAWD